MTASLHLFDPDPDHPRSLFGTCCDMPRDTAAAHYQQPVTLPGGARLGDEVADLELVKQSGCCCRWTRIAAGWVRDAFNLSCPVHARACPACNGAGRLPVAGHS